MTMPQHVAVTVELPDPDRFRQFRAALGWGDISRDHAVRALAGSQFGVVARAGAEIIGFGRVTGDGVLTYYLEDIIVAKAARGRGIGRRIVTELVALIEERAMPGTMIALQAADGAEPFYEALGFSTRPSPGYGAGMTRVVSGDARQPQETA